MAKVTGIGGIFFKARGDHKALAAWYREHLGIDVKPYGGAVFHWSEDPGKEEAATAWQVAEKDTEWFSPSESSFMINYRVDDLAGMVENLKRAGIDILQGPESHEQGDFVWIMDPDGNKLALWEQK